jgi:hypothetical protein
MTDRRTHLYGYQFQWWINILLWKNYFLYSNKNAMVLSSLEQIYYHCFAPLCKPPSLVVFIYCWCKSYSGIINRYLFCLSLNMSVGYICKIRWTTLFHRSPLCVSSRYSQSQHCKIFRRVIKKVSNVFEYFLCMIGNTAEAWSCCSSRSDSDMLRVWFSCTFFMGECGVKMAATLEICISNKKISFFYCELGVSVYPVVGAFCIRCWNFGLYIKFI